MTTKSVGSCGKCRSAGEKLFLKGEKCFGPKCPILKRNFPPGMHGASKKHSKKSDYGKQLFEKQKVRKMYGLREKQFANYVAEASKKSGDTGKFLIQYLESRLDNVVFRMGLGKSRDESRQITNHGHICVNGKKVDIPSYRVKISDVISLSEISAKKPLFAKISEKLAKVEAPSWMSIDASKIAAKILNNPSVDSTGFDSKSIVEFYSR